jgi:predicted Rossmann-fold nucleotide-binding protein
MHERKAEMAKHADAFIALPGQSSSKILDYC